MLVPSCSFFLISESDFEDISVVGYLCLFQAVLSFFQNSANN